MFFDMKSVALYGLMAVAYASPVPFSSIENKLAKRVKFNDFSCPDGTTIAEHDIRQAFHECRRHDDKAIGKYPFPFGNKKSVNGQTVRVLTNVPEGTALREFPIVVGGVYEGGSPGAYRIVTDYKDNRGDFRGVIQHTGATIAGGYDACTPVTSAKRDVEEFDEDEDIYFDAEDDLEVTEDNTPSKRDEEIEEFDEEFYEDIEDETSSSTLVERGNKKKKVGSATCDGTTLSKDAVGAAFKQLKHTDDNSNTRSYPHYFGNKTGNNQAVFGATNDLREFPIMEDGSVWAEGTSPGSYRVVADYNNNFVGVMIEKAGGSFTKCTVNSD